MNPDFFARNIPLANHLIKSEPGKEDKRKDKNRLPALLQQSKINEEDLTPEERERRERERRLNSNQLRLIFSRNIPSFGSFTVNGARNIFYIRVMIGQIPFRLAESAI